MSAIAIPGSASTTLPQINIRPHGHRHGGKVESTDDPSTDSTDTAAQIPVGTAQNAFGSLFQSLEQMIGVQPPTLTTSASGVTTASSPAAAGSALTALTPATGDALTAPSTASTGSAPTPPNSWSASSMLQTYLNNAGPMPPNKIHMNV
jgi:hypothetical protein